MELGSPDGVSELSRIEASGRSFTSTVTNYQTRTVNRARDLTVGEAPLFSQRKAPKKDLAARQQIDNRFLILEEISSWVLKGALVAYILSSMYTFTLLWWRCLEGDWLHRIRIYSKVFCLPLISNPILACYAKFLGQRPLAAYVSNYFFSKGILIFFGLDVLLFAIKASFSNFSCCDMGMKSNT